MDPAWNERGGAADRDYWQSEAFGDLSLSAEQRKELLAGLIPRLSIADRCRVLGRFLLVQGRLRSYKIHLGSGNVLMEPNDQYLCIVPASGVEDRSLVLPFDGDVTLAVILSKAFLLARDESIEDAQILSQIKG